MHIPDPPGPAKGKTMTDTTAGRLRRLASPHSPGPPGSPGRRAATLLLRLGCVALLGWIGYIHLHLWLEGYRQIPTNGPLFLLDAVAGFVLAAGLLAWSAPLAGLLAAGYTAATLGALLISLTVGLFGFRESISASYVAQSLTIEPITTLALLAWTVLVTATPRPPGRPPAAGRTQPEKQNADAAHHLPARPRADSSATGPQAGSPDDRIHLPRTTG
jgi:hypothetical protein